MTNQEIIATLAHLALGEGIDQLIAVVARRCNISPTTAHDVVAVAICDGFIRQREDGSVARGQFRRKTGT